MIRKLNIARKGDYKYVLLSIVITFIILGVAQDLWEAHFRNYHFYWSESLLFKSYWLYFLPIIWSMTQFSFSIGKKNKWLMPIIFGSFIVSIFHLLLTVLTIFLIAQFAFPTPFRWSNILNYFLAQHFIETLLIYGVSLSFLFYKKQFFGKKKTQIPAESISITIDKKCILIKIEDIRFIRTDRPYVAIYTSQKKYLSATTLKQLLTTINHSNFIRVHKSTVLNVKYIDFYTSRQNGDYDIKMNDGTTLKLSRTYAKIFKKAVNHAST